MPKTLVISGHPEPQNSLANNRLLERIKGALPDAEIRELGRLYPNYQIDAFAEKEALESADIIIVAFPLLCYGPPALLKLWIEQIFTIGYAYGEQGARLTGKKVQIAVTIGDTEASYGPQGGNHFAADEYMRPLEQLAYLAGMEWNKPLYAYDCTLLARPDADIEVLEDGILERADDLADTLIQRVDQLISGTKMNVEDFVTRWFRHLHPSQNTYIRFMRFLDKDVEWDWPRGTYFGHEGFKQWYNEMRRDYGHDIDLTIEGIESHENEDGKIDVDFGTHLRATLDNGDEMSAHIHHRWELRRDPISGFNVCRAVAAYGNAA